MTSSAPGVPETDLTQPLPAGFLRQQAWKGFGLLGLAATGLFFVLPRGGAAQAWLMALWSCAAALALAVGIRWHRPEPRLAWRILLFAQCVYAAAGFAWYVYPGAFGGVLSYPSFLDPLYWVTYLGWAVFLVLLSRERVAGDRHIALDALIGGLALSVVVWEVLVGPVVASEGEPGAVLVASTVYPVLLLVLACLALRLALSSRRPTWTDLLLVFWVCAELTGDVWYSLARADGSFRYGDPWFTAWLLSGTALGVLALRPDVGTLAVAGSPMIRMPMPARLLLPAVSAGVPLFVLTVQATDAEPVEAYVLGAVGMLIVGLILLRVQVLSRDLATERNLRAQLGRLAHRLEHTALHDPLTGIPNRAAFEQELARAATRRQDHDRGSALVLLDLDAFKAVNDTYGHHVGDGLLRLSAERLTAQLRPSDLLARIGGDEFAVILDAVDVRAALMLAERLVAATAEPADVEDVRVHPGVSVGVHLLEPGQSARDALVCADAALYAAKTTSAGYELFDAGRHRQFIDRYQIELELRAAPVAGELVLHYQPVLDLSSRRVVSVEALIRWNHPTQGFLGPARFIDVAEQSGAIVDVGRWVLRQACSDAAAWQRGAPGAAGVGVGVNVSRRQLSSPTIVDDVIGALHASALDPALLTLEVTETALNAETEDMAAILTKLRAVGLEIAMDDFGTGYSSLAQLRSLPIDVLKIDKAFVDGVAREEQEWALAAAIIRLAATLGKRTLAEGIERASQLAHLRSLGCELGQGYLFARPMPLDELRVYLAGQPGATRDA